MSSNFFFNSPTPNQRQQKGSTPEPRQPSKAPPKRLLRDARQTRMSSPPQFESVGSSAGGLFQKSNIGLQPASNNAPATTSVAPMNTVWRENGLETIVSTRKRAAADGSSSETTIRAKQRSPSRTIGSNWERELKSLIGTHCPTVEKRCDLLRKRDDILNRMRAEEAADVAGNEPPVLHGNCPDMCPEKERYVRDMQKGLSSYECDQQGQIVHERAVKDYSRSAADQEKPLPHELRPVSVLQTTMDYLIDHIANNMPSNSDDALVNWYDFLWSRTRSIRKDVTQQMLSDAGAVDLVEKCVRLHIFVAFNLAHLASSGFDQAMNTENLQKSLQTLRHMYSDLEQSGEKKCANEAEFRSYDIILNLTDSNVHSQASTYSREVMESEEVRLALSLATSFQGNNYVRFFREVHSRGSYLQCCLCYRYFTTMRCQAFKAIALAYRMFPLEKFTELLAFDGDCASAHFLALVGVEVDSSTNFIQLYPRSANCLARARESVIDEESMPECRWLRNKMHGSTIADILRRGRRLERGSKLQLQPVVNSFDGAGRYTNDPVLREYLRDGAATASGTNAQPKISQPTVAAQKPVWDGAGATTSRAPSFTSSFTFTAPKTPSIFDAPASSTAPMLPHPPLNQEAFVMREEARRREAEKEQRAKEATAEADRRKQAEEARLVAEREVEERRQRQEQLQQEEAERVRLLEAENRRKEQEATRLVAEKEQRQREEDAKRRAHEEEERLMIERELEWQEQCRLEQLRMQKEEAKRIAHLNSIRDNLYKQWLRQFTDHWRAVVKRRRQLRSVSLLNGYTPNSHFSAVLSGSLSRYSPVDTNDIRRAELRRWLLHFRLERSAHIGRIYLAKWRQFMERRRRVHFIDSFFKKRSPTVEATNDIWSMAPPVKRALRNGGEGEDHGKKYFVFSSDYQTTSTAAATTGKTTKAQHPHYYNTAGTPTTTGGTSISKLIMSSTTPITCNYARIVGRQNTHGGGKSEQ